MSSKHLRGDLNYAWPTAEIAVMGPEGAVEIIFKEKIGLSKNPNQTKKDLVTKYKKKFSNPYMAAERGYIDSIIRPDETRDLLISGLAILSTKSDKNPRKKHGNIPL